MTAPSTPPVPVVVDLLPCPFCGAAPEAHPSGDGTGVMIECMSADCVRPHVSYYGEGVAARVWNTRAGAGVGWPKKARWAIEQMREVLSRLQYAKNPKDFDESRLMGVAIGDAALSAAPDAIGEAAVLVMTDALNQMVNASEQVGRRHFRELAAETLERVAALSAASTHPGGADLVAVPRDVLAKLDPGCELGCHPICWTSPTHRDALCCTVKRALSSTTAGEGDE